MGFQDDWVMRQVDMIARFVSQLIFKKQEVTYQITDMNNLTDIDETYLELNDLIEEKKLCEAEDKLFDNVQFSDRYVELSVDFYQKLNKMTDQQLEDADFGRDEVYDGFIEIMTLLGIPVEQYVQ